MISEIDIDSSPKLRIDITKKHENLPKHIELNLLCEFVMLDSDLKTWKRCFKREKIKNIVRNVIHWKTRAVL